MVPNHEARLWRCLPQINRSKKLVGGLYFRFAQNIFFWPKYFFRDADVQSMSACDPIETQKSSQNMILHTVVKETYTICLDHWKFTRLREYQLGLCSPIGWLVLEAMLC